MLTAGANIVDAASVNVTIGAIVPGVENIVIVAVPSSGVRLPTM